ncbi:hypothetical protein EST38_g9166 [Candolleomyces aberdarensis]|uniref:Uncharacterized protein n=1 Tax=Candolleomyces aberdarensis TaxID=2316362 RepID=A0A4Q2DCY3_9AGAR|nr:hypothetical protein EST38_g9166 [Candolleomyces aberdarensis]
MARRATANFRQMSYGTVTAPSTPAATTSASDDTDAASITSSSSKRKVSSPFIQTTRKPSLAVVDNVDVTAAAVPSTYSPSSSPPPLAAAKSVLQGVVAQSNNSDPNSNPNGSAAEPTMFAEEPESMLSESPKMDPVELDADSQVIPGGIDYFSMPPPSSTRAREASDGSDLTKVDLLADPDAGSELEKSTLKRLEAQVSQLLSERKKLAGDLANLQTSHRRLEHELKEKKWAWDAERSTLISERDRERDELRREKTSLTEQLRELSGEKDRLVHDVGQKQMELDWERVRSEEVGKKLEGMETAKEGLQARVSILEATAVEKDRVQERLKGVVSALEAEKQKHLQTISSLEQDFSYAREEMQNAQAQYAMEIEAASTENRLLSQQLADEKAGKEAERAQSLKERSEQQQQFEGARRVLGERVAALVQDVQTKELDCSKLEEELATVKREKEEAAASLQQELESAKEEAKKQIDKLNDKLGKTKKESESRAQRVAELEKEKAEQCTIM